MFGKSQNKRLSFKELTKKFTIAGYIHMQLSSHGFAYCSEHSFKLNGTMCMLRLICCKTPEKKKGCFKDVQCHSNMCFSQVCVAINTHHNASAKLPQVIVYSKYSQQEQFSSDSRL